MTQSTTLSAPLRLLVRLPLWQQILIGLALGVAAGMAFGADAQLLAPIGTLFLNAIKMLIVPLVFVSLVAGITSMQDSAKLGRISLKTIAIYLVTTAFAVSIGLLFGALFSPGEGGDEWKAVLKQVRRIARGKPTSWQQIDAITAEASTSRNVDQLLGQLTIQDVTPTVKARASSPFPCPASGPSRCTTRARSVAARSLSSPRIT